ncbi:MAG: amidase [Ardenticatenaceae bacterium]|nr:amidase [Ardenticatenaceae bacterium]
MSTFPEYEQFDGLGLGELVRHGEVTAAELVEAAIVRIEARNPTLNAVIHKMYEYGRQTAAGPLPKGPFKGVPFLIKDLLAAFAGEPMCSGSKALKNYRPPADSELVCRFKSSGVVILGKTNTPEFGITPFTEPKLFGPTVNPWDTSRSAGGSSGGSGAAVAAGMVPLASGGDGGGSIRIPSSCCGLFGLKPTRGRNPTGPLIGESWGGFAQEHVLTRSVRDSAAMLDATQGVDTGAPYMTAAPERPFLREVGAPPGRLRIAYTTQPLMGHAVHEDCVAGLKQTVELLVDLGHDVVEMTPEVDGEALAIAFLLMLCGEVKADIDEAAELLGRKVTHADFEPETWTLGLLGRAFRAGDYARARRQMQKTARKVGRFFEQVDVLLTPTLAQPPIENGALQATSFEQRAMAVVNRLNAGSLIKLSGLVEPIAFKTFDYMPYTPLFNITGQPAMSLPLYWNGDGLPIGMQFVGRFADEVTLFRLAGQLEEARPWKEKQLSIIN